MCQRTLLFGSILDPANVAYLDGRAVDVCDDEFFHIARVGKTPERSQNQFTPPRLDVSARHVCVLSLQSVAHRGDGKFVSCQPLRIDPDIDRALQTTNDVDLADTFGTLELRTNDFVAVFGQLAKRSLTRKGDGDDRRTVVIEFSNDRRLHVGRQVADDRSDAIANILGRSVDVAIKIERRHHERRSLPGNRAQLIDAIDGVDDFFDSLRDERLHLFRRRAGQISTHADGGKIDGRKTIDAQLEITRRADDDQRQNDHRGEDRAADTNFSELLHGRILDFRF